MLISHPSTYNTTMKNRTQQKRCKARRYTHLQRFYYPSQEEISGSISVQVKYMPC